MKIERLKSILLIMLVISSIVLTANKWFSEELWPEGYGFFSDVKNKISGNSVNKSKPFNPNEEILKPAKIIVNNLSNHVPYTKSHQAYDNLSKEITNILYSAFSSDTIKKSNSEEWNSQLQTKSFYLIYPVKYDASYFASQLSKEYKGEIKCFKEFVIAFDQRISSAMYIYVKDAQSDMIERIRIDYDGKIFEDYISNAQTESNDINYYSFELNFDASDTNGVKDHVIIDNNVLLNISDKKANEILETNLFADIANNEDLYTSILDKFNFNTTTIRKYIEVDNSMVFVENYGTLKLHSNGMLDYKAMDKTKGIELNDSTVKSTLNSCITFVNSIDSIINNDKNVYYEISSDIHDIKNTNFSMTFDYYINDSIIMIPAEKSPVHHAINLEVEDGRIVSYTHIFSSYTILEGIVSCGSAIDAVDILKDNSNSDNISDIFVAYSYNAKEQIWTPGWYIKDSKGNISTVFTKTEVDKQ